jgi:hypothetical protein
MSSEEHLKVMADPAGANERFIEMIEDSLQGIPVADPKLRAAEAMMVSELRRLQKTCRALEARSKSARRSR